MTTPPTSDILSYRSNTSGMVDILIYVPHAELYHPKKVLPYFPHLAELDQEALRWFCLLDADIGSREIAEALYQMLISKGLSVGLLDIQFPRAVIDMNRRFYRASPPLFANPQFESLFNQILAETEQYFGKAQHTIHMHTMASNNRTELWEPSSAEEFTLERVMRYCENQYRGSPRGFNLLTGNSAGELFVDGSLIQILQKHLDTAGYASVQNEAYSLEDGYPTTDCLKKYSGSAFDIPKRYLGTETSCSENPAKIILDQDAISKLAEILSEAYLEWWEK